MALFLRRELGNQPSEACVCPMARLVCLILSEAMRQAAMRISPLQLLLFPAGRTSSKQAWLGRWELGRSNTQSFHTENDAKADATPGFRVLSTFGLHCWALMLTPI